MANNRQLSLIQQLNVLKHEYPQSKGNVLKSKMVWRCSFQPSALSDTYCLKVTYSLGSKPKAYIESPHPLRLAIGAKMLPHTYNDKYGKQRLCLFLPQEWREDMLISNSIVHWAIQRMYYYEFWASTGRWLGGGHGNWDVQQGCDNNQIPETYRLKE